MIARIGIGIMSVIGILASFGLALTVARLITFENYVVAISMSSVAVAMLALGIYVLITVIKYKKDDNSPKDFKDLP